MSELIYGTITAVIVSTTLNFIFRKLFKGERKRFYPAWMTNIFMVIVLVATSGLLVSLGWFYVGAGTAAILVLVNQIFPTK